MILVGIKLLFFTKIITIKLFNYYSKLRRFKIELKKHGNY